MQNITGTTSQSYNPVHVWQRRVLYASLAGYLVSRLPLLAALDTTADSLGWRLPIFLLVNGLFLAGLLAAFFQTRRQQLKAAAGILVTVLILEASLYLLAGSWESLRGWAELWIGIGLAHLLLSQRESRVIVLAAVVVIVFSGAQELRDLSPDGQREQIAVMLATLAWTLALAVIERAASQGNQLAIQTLLRDFSTRHLIESGQSIARHAAQRSEVNVALQTIAGDLEQRWSDIHHVQIFLIEPESDHAVLTAATGTAGQQLLNQDYKLGIGGLSPVGRATLTGRPLLIADFGRETIHTPHDLLADMRAEMVIPLKAAERVIGAIDLYSRQVDAFSRADMTLFEAIAHQVALTVDTLQLYAEMQQKLRENRALYEQTQMNLREIERLNYQLTGRAWGEYLRLHSDITAMTLNLETGEAALRADWTPTLNEAAEHHQVITVTAEGKRIVALPIIVRNEVVGAMEFELPHDDELPGGALELVTAVGQRLGLALENRRLFDETQRIAQREGLINDIGTELQATTSVDTIIQRTANRLQEMLSAQQVTIRISAHDTDQG